MVRRCCALLLAALALPALAGCRSNLLPRPRDITQVQLIRTIGLDLAGEGEGIRVTVSGAVRRGGEQGQSEPPLLLSQEGDTAFTAAFALQTGGGGTAVDYGHVTEFVLGEDLARTRLDGLLDYLERDFELRLDTQVYLTAGATAEEALRGSASRTGALTDRLAAICQDESLGGWDWPYTLRHLLSQLGDNGCALLPVLSLADNPDYDPERPEEAAEREVSLSGLAYLGDGRLVGILDRERARGAALLTGQCQNDGVEAVLPGGAVAGVTLVHTSCYWEPHFDRAGRLVRLVGRIRVKGELSELRGVSDPYDAAIRAEIETALKRLLEDQAQAVLDLSQAEGVDFLHLRREMLVQCPLRTGALREHWEEWFPALRLEAAVEATLERSYDVGQTAEGGDAA